MLKILINAYACCPGMGSEQGMAWNWCSHLAKHCEQHIITESEYRAQIDEAVANLPQGRNMRFHFITIGGSEEKAIAIRKMCWNQGDWRFYRHYEQWQKAAYNMACGIIEHERIDIIHQLNMIGFREPGYLWKIDGIPFVWGSIGGLKQFPTAYLKGAGWKMSVFMRLKNLINILQLKCDRRVDKALRRADLLISSIPDSHWALKKHKGLESVVIPETGCFPTEDKHGSNSQRFECPCLKIIWVGKFDFRKRLDIALSAIAKADNPQLHLQVYGTGSKQQMAYYKLLANRLGINSQVEFMGNRPNKEVLAAMGESDVFLFTSVSEDTSTVVLEAVSHGLPVVCFDACGMSAVIDGSVGVKIPLTTPTQSIEDFAKALNALCADRPRLKSLSNGCAQRSKELSWDGKAEKMVELYHRAIKQRSSLCLTSTA